MRLTHEIRITQDEGFRFVVDFGDAIPNLQVDEIEPISHEAGPCPEQMLVTSVANCLCASLFFALTKYRNQPRGISATARCCIQRNERGRLRVEAIDVAIQVGAEAADMQHLERALSQFEDFCTVSESIKQGVPVSVSVHDGQGKQLK